MKRRSVLSFSVLSLVAAALAQPRYLLAQPAERRFRVGMLWVADEPNVRPVHSGFVRGLQERGYVIGRNLLLDVRHAGGDQKRISSLIDELISEKPDVLVAIESVAVMMRGKTTSIPIVVPGGNDLVAAGLVESLARPGTNVTGTSIFGDQLVAKQLELLVEIAPKMKRVAYLRDPQSPAAARTEEFARKAAEAKGVSLVAAGAVDPDGVREAFSTFARENAEGVIVVATGRMNQLRLEILTQLQRSRLPSISGLPAQTWAEAGGLATYAADFVETWRYTASYVDRILKGARPTDLPVEQITKLEFVLNLKTARALGLTIPPSILLRADRVIE